MNNGSDQRPPSESTQSVQSMIVIFRYWTAPATSREGLERGAPSSND